MQLHRTLRGSSRCFLILTGEEGRTNAGVSFTVTLGGLFAGKQVGRSVMREDSWQVQWRLTAKLRWQRGKTEELSLCDRFEVIPFF